uniref:Uncharacterized protein LOC111109547 isoform X2 n=1 Tax=Crassostrea virginica TaxID=6565 RepID=A0A8B8BDY0_CRAVI|nr:uncharacterized protein LOC111109547 isoform X2 [Crassostrea virginica]
MYRMRFVTVCLLIVHTAFAMISIQVQNTFIKLGRTDIDIKCLVNDSEIASIKNIQLRRSSTNIVSVKESLPFWQDVKLQQRANAYGSVINATFSYLHMMIDSQKVTTNDEASYSCKTTVQYRNKTFASLETGNVYLNITDVSGFQRSQHSAVLIGK